MVAIAVLTYAQISTILITIANLDALSPHRPHSGRLRHPGARARLNLVRLENGKQPEGKNTELPVMPVTPSRRSQESITQHQVRTLRGV